jgi:hypothetical protein
MKSMSCEIHGSLCKGVSITASSVTERDQVIGKSGNSYPVVKILNRFGRTIIIYGSGEKVKTSDGSSSRPIIINERVKKEYSKIKK